MGCEYEVGLKIFTTIWQSADAILLLTPRVNLTLPNFRNAFNIRSQTGAERRWRLNLELLLKVIVPSTSVGGNSRNLCLNVFRLPASHLNMIQKRRNLAKILLTSAITSAIYKTKLSPGCAHKSNILMVLATHDNFGVFFQRFRLANIVFSKTRISLSLKERSSEES